MFYTVYKITNSINNRIYVGAHRTENLNDGYLGSGYVIKSAIRLYGKEFFNKELLFVFDNKEDMFAKEREIVNETFVNDPMTYNIKLGGWGGFDTIDHQSDEHRSIMRSNRTQTNQKLLEKYGEDWRRIISQKGKINSKLALDRLKENPDFYEKIKQQSENGRQQALSETAKQKRKETMKSKGHSQGDKNSQFGTMWINNSIENKKIKKDAQVPDGWVKGRKI